jgi:hypothetical protein
MKHSGIISIVLAASLILATGVEAQILNRLKQRAQDRVERRVEQKIENEVDKTADQMVDNAFDSVFGGFEDEDGEGGRSLPFSFNSNVTTEEVYHFDTITTMEINTEKRGKKEDPVIMEMHFNEGEMYTGTSVKGENTGEQEGDVFLIYDLKNSAMIMLMESEDGKFSFAYDWAQAVSLIEDMEEEQSESETMEPGNEEENEWPGYERIGQKSILGYSCDGYRNEAENTVTEIWVTRDVAYGMGTMFQANANTKQMRGKVPKDHPYGMMMQTITENKDNNEKMTMTVTDIRKNAGVDIRMSDYPTMGM